MVLNYFYFITKNFGIFFSSDKLNIIILLGAITMISCVALLTTNKLSHSELYNRGGQTH